ncbi:MAG: heavy metal translocating P-type ATPase, partial [Parachlamydiaceae bacterium]|nr:heavy metal translocating P-type ATPase [Parachlamydiaceae bacterium]
MIEFSFVPRSPHVKTTVFEDYFGLGKEEWSSPFLTGKARKWGSHLSLKISLLSSLFFLISYALSFFTFLMPISNLFLFFVYFFTGIPFLIASLEDLFNFDVNIDMLMTLAAFSSVLIDSSMEGGLLLILFALSGSIQETVTNQSRKSLTQLHQLSPTKATVVENKELIERPIRTIKAGTKLFIRAGEIVPLDGMILDGVSSVNLIHLTGESQPILKKPGDSVPAGARNLDGTFTLEVTKTNAESTLTQMIQLVTEAQEAKPPLQKWFDQLSQTYSLSIILLSILFALVLPFVFSISFLGHEGSIYRAIAFLVAASPCALIIALPIAYLSAVSACAREGILIKGGAVLDALSKCSVIAFDKTGTLTTGNLSLNEFHPIGTIERNWSDNEILSIAYGLEIHVTHPIAKAVTAFAIDQGIKEKEIKNIKAISGYGLEGILKDNNNEIPVYMGHPDYIRQYLSDSQQIVMNDSIQNDLQKGFSIALLLIDKDLFIFSFQDTIRPNIEQTIQRLKNIGKWKLLMLTGDHKESAIRVANKLGIDEFYSNLRPENKLQYVTQLSQLNGLAMVGDGINDAPALARATVGICMGKVGSGTAIEVADVVLLQDNLERLDWLMLKGNQTHRIVIENLCIAAGAILLATLPTLAGWIPLWVAVLMH